MCLIERYRAYLKHRSNFSEGKINRICYSAESIINDLSKVLILILIGWCIGKRSLFTSILFTYTLLRPFLGGVHKDTYWKCFFSTLGFLLLGTFIVMFTSFGGVYTAIYTIFICAIGIATGPVPSPKKKRIKQSEKKKNQIIALIVHVGIGVIYLACGKEEIQDGLLAGLWLAHGQIIYLSIQNKKGEKEKWKMY